MKTLTYILAVLTSLVGVPLLWHALMPVSAHWMQGTQIGASFMFFILTSIGCVACWLSLNNKI